MPTPPPQPLAPPQLPSASPPPLRTRFRDWPQPPLFGQQTSWPPTAATATGCQNRTELNAHRQCISRPMMHSVHYIPYTATPEPLTSLFILLQFPPTPISSHTFPYSCTLSARNKNKPIPLFEILFFYFTMRHYNPL